MKQYRLIHDESNEEYPYNVQCYIDGWYSGYGKFFKTLKEAEMYLSIKQALENANA